ncbi:hypothetical protein JHK86_004165 [Glycine max]|nr:hypothetical protein JHK86_004165 [Glycine max]
MVGVLESIKFEFLGYAPLAPAAVGKLESPSWATEPFPKSVPPVLPPTRLPHNLFPDSVPLTLIESPSSLAKQGARNEELKRADAVVLTYACDEPVKVPVIVVGCKLDLRDENQLVSLESLTTHIMKHFIEVVTCVECSAATLYQVPQVFYFAQKEVLHPVDPLFDYKRHALTDPCVRALRRIFVLCDHDMDGALNDEELNEFLVRCFSAPLQPSEIAEVKTIVEQKVPEGVNSIGLTFPGFIYVHNMFLKKGQTETLWAVLRKFGYDNDLKLWDDFLPVPSKQASDQDRSLRPAEVDKLFDTAPESPWNDAPYKDAAEKTDMGYISLNGFLSQNRHVYQTITISYVHLIAWKDTSKEVTYWLLSFSLENSFVVGHCIPSVTLDKLFPCALRVTHRRSVDHKKQTTEKNVFQCYVFGSKHAGKSALLYSLPGKVTRKILILHEIPEDGLLQFLSNQDCLAACDVAVFCGTYESSWKKSRDLLEKVVRQGELTGYRTPCLLIAAKDDLAPFPRTVLDSVKVTQALGVFTTPSFEHSRTQTAQRKKQHHQLLHHSLIFALVGAAMAVAGLTACRVRAVKKNTTA